MSLRSSLKEDEAYTAFKKVCKYCTQLADYDSVVKELEGLHAGRKSRTMYLHKPSLDRVIEASAQNTSYRSRCVEILNSVLKAQRLLQAAIDRIEAHVLSNYRDKIQARSQADKKTLMHNMFSSAYYQLADLERISEMATHIIHDIDQSGFAIKHILDSLKVLYTKEHMGAQ